ncbi:MAG: tryptophan synthase subunit alpha, partial [Pseudomonadales bacterium]|nr:tryptophan synthase subunit alpha [Pseudomonadales bacterium]
AGDPTPEMPVELMHGMVDAGASIIELGFPFSDPEAEGPVIQAGHERARAHDTTLTDTLEMVRQFRGEDQDTPVILMGYVNPVEVMGYERFADAAAGAGVDGMILVNMPPEEGEVPGRIFEERQIDTVYLLAPTTSPERAAYICKKSRGFVYYVSLKGVTGASTLNVDEVKSRVELYRDICDLPLAVGFGIKDGESAGAVAGIADGVVVGSALVQIIGDNVTRPDQIVPGIKKLIGEMRQAIDSATC